MLFRQVPTKLLFQRNLGRTTPPELFVGFRNLFRAENILCGESHVRGFNGMSSGMYRKFDRLFCHPIRDVFDYPAKFLRCFVAHSLGP